MVKSGTYYIVTYGCQMNEYDSQRAEAVLESFGYIQGASVEDASFVLINTCTVREKPFHKMESLLGRIYKDSGGSKGVKVGIMGCIAQQEGERILSRFSQVSCVMGTDALVRFPQIFPRVMAGERVVDIAMNPADYHIDSFKVTPNISMYVSVMKGCDKYCSYCIVPFVRGREVSRPLEDIITEIERLALGGTKEVTLLGQNINSYGKNLTNGGDINFSSLLRAVNGVDGIERIRFMTSNPWDFDEDIVDTMAECEKVCEYLHLPLQSGSNRILKSMRRNHTIEEYIRKVEYAKAKIPGLTLSSDFIVGFPGETEEDFQQTMEAMDVIGYDMVYSFIYSPRPNTKSLAMEDRAQKVGRGISVPLHEQKRRLATMMDAADERRAKDRATLQGTTVEVLVTGASKTDSTTYTGRSRQNMVVNFVAQSQAEIQPGSLVTVRVDAVRRYALQGTHVHVAV